MARPNFEKLEVYQLSEQLADRIWTMVLKWDRLAQDTLGKQLIRAADSVGANIAEGTGRGSHLDNRRFVRIAQGSLNEVTHFLRRAYRRDLLVRDESQALEPLVTELCPRLAAYHRSISPHPKNKAQRTKNDRSNA